MNKCFEQKALFCAACASQSISDYLDSPDHIGDPNPQALASLLHTWTLNDIPLDPDYLSTVTFLEHMASSKVTTTGRLSQKSQLVMFLCIGLLDCSRLSLEISRM